MLECLAKIDKLRKSQIACLERPFLLEGVTMYPRIVICDDEPHITLAVSMKLSKAGFTVETAPDGMAAWELIQRDPPCLVITDCQMPRMNGIELCRLIRTQPETAHIPVFMLTAKGMELDRDALASELGVSRVILKPFSPRELLKAVNEALLLTPVGAPA